MTLVCYYMKNYCDVINKQKLITSPQNLGPFGEQDDEQVFVQKVVPETDQLFVRLASNGKRVCVIKSVDGSIISSFYVHECEGSSRMGSRPRRFIFTGHSNGTIQMWDLTTALEPSFSSTQSNILIFFFFFFNEYNNINYNTKHVNCRCLWWPHARRTLEIIRSM